MGENKPKSHLKSVLKVAVVATVGTVAGLAAGLEYYDWQLGQKIVGATANLVQGDVSKRGFDPPPPPRPKPVVSGYDILSANDSGEAVRDSELVIGVLIDGTARAYPVNMLGGPDREIINDELAGRPIAVTFCHLCHTAYVYSRVVQDETLTFQVSMLLWGNNLVMIDRQTESLWSQFLGEAMHGSHKGRTLELIPSEIVSWQRWKQRHPRSTVLVMKRSALRYREEGASELAKSLIVGMAEEGNVRAWQLSALKEHPVVNDQFGETPVVVVLDRWSASATIFERTVGGQVLTFAFQKGKLLDEETGTTWDPRTGAAIGGEASGEKKLSRLNARLANDIAWAMFYPDSTMWKPDSKPVAVPATERTP